MTEHETQQEIDELIRAENDPKARAQLMVLSQLSKSLCINTAATQAIATRLEDHIKESKERHQVFLEHAKKEDELVNKGRGAWKVLAWLMGAAQAVVIYLWFGLNSSIDEIKNYSVSDKIEHIQLKSEIERLRGQ